MRLLLIAAVAAALLSGPVRAAEPAGGASVLEPQRQIPVTHAADVVVIGASDGGLGGCTAAVAAARRGASVLLIEKSGQVQLHVPTALGFVIGIQGWRPTIEEGMFREYARYCSETGQYAAAPMTFEETLRSGEIIVRYHDVAGTAMLRMMSDAGARALFHTRFAGVAMEGQRVKAIIVESPRGRHAIAGKVFVDSTALGEVAAAAGAPMKREEAYLGVQAIITGVDETKFRQWERQNDQPLDDSFRTWMQGLVGPFEKLEHPWNQWFPEYLGDRMSPAVARQARAAQENGQLTIVRRRGAAVCGIVEGIKSNPNVARPRTYITGVDPLDVDAMAWAEAVSREALIEFQCFLKARIPGFEQCVLERVSESAGMRGGRFIDIDEVIDGEVVARGQRNADCIYLFQRGAEGEPYEVPYRALLPQRVDNLLVVGKATGGGVHLRTAHGVLLQGQAAGTAAALAVQQQLAPRQLDIRELQAALARDGVTLPERLLAAPASAPAAP